MAESEKSHVPLIFFVVMFLVALIVLSGRVIAGLLLDHQLPERDTWERLLEHLGSAILVASLMGITYERFMHARAIGDFKGLLSQQGREVEHLLASVRATDAHGVFALLRDIAEHQKNIPTLYRPARGESEGADEFVFSTHVPFFKDLIAARHGREQVVAELREWCDPGSKISVRFLGSDFIGLLQLDELRDHLQSQAAEASQAWKTLNSQEKGCALNYVWAASRCEKPMYQTLGELLLETPDEFIQKWILWVPLQMADARLAELIDRFLARRGGEVPVESVRAAIAAIGALHRHLPDMKKIINRHRALIEECNLTEFAAEQMSTLTTRKSARGRRPA